MTVRSILEFKGRDVVTMARGETLADVTRLLAEKKIGAVVVVDSQRRILGIVSERDVVRAIAANGASCLERPVSDFMTRNVTCCNESNTVNQVMELMTHGRFRHLPVETGGQLAGLVSIGDVVRRRMEEVEREAEEMKAYIAS